MKRQQIFRKCSICNVDIVIKIAHDFKYKGGHYFGKLALARGELEYWECNKCYKS